MRMKWHQELRWLAAGMLVGWALRLVEREASTATLDGFAACAEGLLNNDRRHNTVPLQKQS